METKHSPSLILTNRKFYGPGAQLVPPVHIEPEVLDHLAARAEARGTSFSALVNELLKSDIEGIEAWK